MEKKNSKKHLINLFVPGRVCLFGEHSDWAGGYRRIDSSISMGYTIVTGLTMGIYAKVAPNPKILKLTSTLPDGKKIGPIEIEMKEDVLLEYAKNGGFFSYIAGVAYFALVNYHVKGLELESYLMDLPIRKGLSSSAAICVLAARAFNMIYDLKLTIRGEMEMGYRGEIYTPSRCGRMDQACAYGPRPVFMTFDGDEISIDLFKLHKPMHIVIVDLKAGKDTKKILADLNGYFPSGGGKIGEDVRYYLGPVNKEILHSAKAALKEGDYSEVGRLMTEAQRLFDQFLIPACPSELSAPKLHKILECESIQELVYGGKGVGSQGDGCAQFLTKGHEETNELIRRLEAYNVNCFPITLNPTSKININPETKTEINPEPKAEANE